MDKLKKRAEELGVGFDDETTEEVLKDLISDKEKELESNLEHWKTEAEKWKTEAKTAFDKRDQFKGDRDRLSNKIKEMEKSMITMIPSDEKTKLEDELKQLKEFKENYDKEKEEEELKNKTEVERLEMRIKKQAEEFQKQLDSFKEKTEKIKKENEEKTAKSKAEIEVLRTSKLEAEIIKEAANLNAWNPEQIFWLTKDKFTYDPDLGKFSYQKRDSVTNKLDDELSVKEYLTEFLGEERNENLIRSNANTTSFNTKGDRTEDKKTHDLGKYNPKDPEIIEKAAFAGMEPERYIRVVLKKQDALKERMANK